MWRKIRERVRKFRLLREVVEDAKALVSNPRTKFYRQKQKRHPDMPRRPLSTYMLFYMEKKDKVARENPGLQVTGVSKCIADLYKSLPAKKKQKYVDMAAAQRRDYAQKLEEFYRKHPNLIRKPVPSKYQKPGGLQKPRTPFKMFYEDKENRHKNDPDFDQTELKERCKEKWRNMSDKKKVVWINWSLEEEAKYQEELKVYMLENPNFVPTTVKTVLTKEEKNLKERMAGKPEKPPHSGYNLFSRIMLVSPEIKQVPSKECMCQISKLWKSMTESAKKKYQEQVNHKAILRKEEEDSSDDSDSDGDDDDDDDVDNDDDDDNNEEGDDDNDDGDDSNEEDDDGEDDDDNGDDDEEDCSADSKDGPSDNQQYRCTKPCTRKNAGCKEVHMCRKKCYEECGDCMIHVERKLPHCEHSGHMPCHMDPETYLCRRRCDRILPCQHQCPNICCEKCGNCPVKVLKQIDACGHTVQVKCCEKPDPTMCQSPCNRLLRCGHKCTAVCSALCTAKCQELVPCAIRPACGHMVDVPCYMQNQILDPFSEELLSRCQVPCGAVLSCGHRCRGTCGECMQGRIHMACKEKCGKTLICGHSCNMPCAESCLPCNRKCTYTCKHSRCSRNCGQPCMPCKEPCEWSCIHHRCRKLCYDLCDREPCYEPCRKLLRCKHPCIGFCGEPCPPLCRVCDKDEVTEVFFGDEDEPDARFIYLEDCKHVLEATGLEQWMAQTDGQIKLKDCPKCKTPIAKTQRFMNTVKKVYQDVQRVKKRVFGNMREIEASRDELRKKLYELDRKLCELITRPVIRNHYLIRHTSLLEESTEFRKLHTELLNKLRPVQWKKVKILSATDTATLRVQIEIFSQVVECCYSTYPHLVGQSKAKILAHMDMLLRVVRQRGKKVSEQEVGDINMEIQRFHRVCQLHRLKSEPRYRVCRNIPKVKESYETAHQIAYTIVKYSKEFDWKLKNALENLSRVVGSAVKITDAERKEIVRAMGYRQGHWYKCPNGHIYIITECGGAMETSRCSECGAAIGGGSHRLLESNSVATEMDGATRPAWPQ